MARENDIVAVIKKRQCAMRREMDRRGLSLKAIAFDSGVSYSSLLTYFPKEGGADPVQLPTSVQFQLCDVVPNDILSLLLPDNHANVTTCSEIDHDELDRLCRDYVKAKADAHRADSPGGPVLVDSEDAILRAKATALRAAA